MFNQIKGQAFFHRKTMKKTSDSIKTKKSYPIPTNTETDAGFHTPFFKPSFSNQNNDIMKNSASSTSSSHKFADKHKEASIVDSEEYMEYVKENEEDKCSNCLIF